MHHGQRRRSAPQGLDLGVHRAAQKRRAIYRRRRLMAAGALVALAVLLGLLLSNGNAPQTGASGQTRVSRVGRARKRLDTPTHPRAHISLVAQELRTNRHVLSYTSYLGVGTPLQREIALTFDDGPGPFTLPILHVLEHFHVRATFFEIGRNVHAYPRFTARLAQAGMVIGDHTEEHPPMAQLEASEQASELDDAASAIARAGAPRPLLFRPPYGSFSPTTLGLLRERNMVMVLWTVDTSDYAQPGVERIIYTALSGARPGAVILFHDGGGDRAQTLAALPRIIERLRQRGYGLVTVPELLRNDPPPRGQPAPVSLAGD
jgi:peptidoglycan/xylan/chitin deacetylase (PgdA/CDA1 family)